METFCMLKDLWHFLSLCYQLKFSALHWIDVCRVLWMNMFFLVKEGNSTTTFVVCLWRDNPSLFPSLNRVFFVEKIANKWFVSKTWSGRFICIATAQSESFIQWIALPVLPIFPVNHSSAQIGSFLCQCFTWDNSAAFLVDATQHNFVGGCLQIL